MKISIGQRQYQHADTDEKYLLVHQRPLASVQLSLRWSSAYTSLSLVLAANPMSGTSSSVARAS
ncbi:hypothetical protein M378DRAFT_166497 [Amanita muscaria Koide BX008]|uniref:Uncharacterized protein n=1 Tax=Amanita muscaria (strain Koide BX008) TaxID=946122 RepID=A0A0C2T575_AMAMK|nr:hypothetical protein M378DRAFT_166497 [Amanita muscaria Koide BX008]